MNKFTLKIGDLLKEPGKKDFVEFRDIHTEHYPNITKEWVSWSFEITSLNEKTLSVSVEINCKIEDYCDRCSENFTRIVETKEYVAKFIVPATDEEEDIDEIEELFPIDPKSFLIDTENLIIHTIGSEEPISKKCEKCLKEIKNYDDEEDVDYFESNANVLFS